MSYSINLSFSGPGFVAVPNHVADHPALMPDALGVLVYLCRLAGGRSSVVVSVGAVRQRFGFGRDRWQRISRNLREVGALTDAYTRSTDGRAVVRSFVIDWPAPAQAAAVQSCEPGNPVHTSQECGLSAPCEPGFQQVDMRVSRSLKRDTYKKQACAADAAHPARAASPRNAASRACSEGVGAVAQVSRAVAPAVPGDVSACAESRQARASEAVPQVWAHRVRALSPFLRSMVRKGATVALPDLGMVSGASPEGQALQAALKQMERAQ